MIEKIALLLLCCVLYGLPKHEGCDEKRTTEIEELRDTFHKKILLLKFELYKHIAGHGKNDKSEAILIECYKEVAKFDSNAALELGEIFLLGGDFAQAEYYWNLGAQLGDMRGAELLGKIYFQGRKGKKYIIERNLSKSSYYHKWAAELGSHNSKQFLADMCENGYPEFE